jgi:hypothetical protein
VKINIENAKSGKDQMGLRVFKAYVPDLFNIHEVRTTESFRATQKEGLSALLCIPKKLF